MERIRKSLFSGSWYPDTQEGVVKQLEKWDADLGPSEKNAFAGIVPHAGWYFSGKQAYDVIRRFKRDLQALVVLGGHLPGSYPFLHWTCQSCETPIGNLEVHDDLRNHLTQILQSAPDDSPDNTIEVQLPLIRETLGNIPIVPMRAPAGESCLKIVHAIEDYAAKENLRIGVVGSTDLTHYGPNYDFMPKGSEKDPITWVEKSDKRIIDAMVSMKSRKILELAHEFSSACSAGAAASTASYGKTRGSDQGVLLSYDTSYSKHQADSFVGYGAVIYTD